MAQNTTVSGFHWHGQLIEKILTEKPSPYSNGGNGFGKGEQDYPATIEPLYIIGSGFINAQQLTFYRYLSQFTDVYQFWLTPTRVPLGAVPANGRKCFGAKVRMTPSN